MKTNTIILGTLTSVVVVSAVFVAFNLLRKGEPRYLQAVAMALCIGVSNTLVLLWFSKKKSDAHVSESSGDAGAKAEDNELQT